MISQPPVVGLVLTRPAQMLGLELYYMELISGVEEVLEAQGASLSLHIVADAAAEIATYKRWQQHGLVDGVLIANIEAGDKRLAALDAIGLPAVVLGGPERYPDRAHVWVDNAEAARMAVRHLGAQGHRSIARVSGLAHLAHTQTRDAAFQAQCQEQGIAHNLLAGNYEVESGAALTKQLLDEPQLPTAIIFDNDQMALGGLQAISARGLEVGQDIAVLAWDDSSVTRLAEPPLSAMQLSVHHVGVLAGQALMSLLVDGELVSLEAPAPKLIVRASTSRVFSV